MLKFGARQSDVELGSMAQMQVHLISTLPKQRRFDILCIETKLILTIY